MQLRVYVNEDSDGVTCGSFFRFLRHVDIDIRIGSDRRGGQVRHAGAGAIRGFVFHVTDGREAWASPYRAADVCRGRARTVPSTVSSIDTRPSKRAMPPRVVLLAHRPDRGLRHYVSP